MESVQGEGSRQKRTHGCFYMRTFYSHSLLLFIAIMCILIITKFEVIEYDCTLNYGTNKTKKQCSISIYFSVFGRE